MPMDQMCIDILSVANRHNILLNDTGLLQWRYNIFSKAYGATAPYAARGDIVAGLVAGIFPNLILFMIISFYTDYHFIYFLCVAVIVSTYILYSHLKYILP